MRNSSGTSSVPTSLISEMSLRRRSTIMRFSAWFFSSLRRNSLSCGIFLRRLAARRGALHRMGLDPALGVDLEEQFRRARQHHRPAERDQRAILHRLALDQRVEGVERLAGPVRAHRKGQVAPDSSRPGAGAGAGARSGARSRLRRPCRAGVEDRAVGGGIAGRQPVAVGRLVEHAEADQRRAPSLGQQRPELRFEQVAGLVGEIAGQPFARFVRLLGRVERGEEILGAMRRR